MEPATKRAKKSDKAKRTYELHGKYTAKHLRTAAAAAATHSSKPSK